MLCNTCGIDVPPAFKLAIENNQCPGCWGPILTEEVKGLMSELTEAIKKMDNDPQGLAGWILSTFEIKRKGSIEPTVFHGPPVSKNLKVADNPISKFMKNAGVEHLANNEKYKNLLNQIGSDHEEIEVSENEVELSENNSLKSIILPGNDKPLDDFEIKQIESLISNKEPELHPALNAARKLRLAKANEALSGAKESAFTRG